MTRPDAPRRHGWAWLGGDWTRHIHSPLAPQEFALAHEWDQAGHPFVVAGRGCTDSHGDVRLGLSTPDKTRIGLHLSREALLRTRPALALEEARTSIPDGWRDSLRMVEDIAHRAGLGIRVYGSLAWTHWSGLPFVRAGSDIDLLLEVGPDSRRPAVYEALRSLATMPATPRLDGELVLPGGLAVAWRELTRQSEEILVKGAGAPRLLDRREWDRLIEPGAA